MVENGEIEKWDEWGLEFERGERDGNWEGTIYRAWETKENDACLKNQILMQLRLNYHTKNLRQLRFLALLIDAIRRSQGLLYNFPIPLGRP